MRVVEDGGSDAGGAPCGGGVQTAVTGGGALHAKIRLVEVISPAGRYALSRALPDGKPSKVKSSVYSVAGLVAGRAETRGVAGLAVESRAVGTGQTKSGGVGGAGSRGVDGGRGVAEGGEGKGGVGTQPGFGGGEGGAGDGEG